MHPLPELHARDLSGRGVLHEIIEGNASVTAYPGGGVRETRLDVFPHPFGGDMSGDVRAQEISSGDLDLRAEFVVLERRIPSKKTRLKFVNTKNEPDWVQACGYRRPRERWR